MDYPMAELPEALPQTNWVYGDGIGTTVAQGMQSFTKGIGTPHRLISAWKAATAIYLLNSELSDCSLWLLLDRSGCDCC